MSVLVFTVTGYGWSQYQSLANGIDKSDALAGLRSANGDINILVMGLDSRLDENGNPLPPDIYDALHAGDQQDGGYNANVLMLLHLPGNGAKATSISIPRDDYVDLAGSPDGVSKGKIKQAYGFAFDQEHSRLVAAGVTDQAGLEQRSRDAGRKAEIETVRQFLGGVPIDHFIEVTLVAFYQLAQVVQPLTVCLKEATQDSYSGADFHPGYQQINASQAVAFVRQRRDYQHPELNFTDLDRERRQQAFIASLAYQLKQAGTFTNPGRLSEIINVAKQNIATDSGLDLLAFAREAAILAGGNITFTTLPISRFDTDPAGEDVNIVDVSQIRSLVHRLIGSPTPASGAATAGPPEIVDVVNAAGHDGLAASLEHRLAGSGFTPGSTSTYSRTRTRTMIYYPRSGLADAANTLAERLDAASVAQDSTVPAGHLRVVLGTDFTMPDSLPTAHPAVAASSPTDSTSPTASTSPAPPPPSTESTDPGSISGGGIPCVK